MNPSGVSGSNPYQYVGASNRKSLFRQDMSEEEQLAMQAQFMQSGVEPSASFVRHKVDKNSIMDQGLLDTQDGTNPSVKQRRKNIKNVNNHSIDVQDDQMEDDDMEMGPCATLVRAERPAGGIGKISNAQIVKEVSVHNKNFLPSDMPVKEDSDTEEADYRKVMGGLAVGSDVIVAKEKPKKKKVRDVISFSDTAPTQNDVVAERVRSKPKSTKIIEKTGFPGFTDNFDVDNQARGDSLFSKRRHGVTSSIPTAGTKLSAFALQKLNETRNEQGESVVLVNSQGYVVNPGDHRDTKSHSIASTQSNVGNMDEYTDICGVTTRDISNDASNTFHNMSEQEKLQAKEELLSTMSPDLIAALRRRKLLREKKNTTDAPTNAAVETTPNNLRKIDHTGASLTDDMAPHEYIPQVAMSTDDRNSINPELSSHLDTMQERKKASWLLPYQESENQLKGGGDILPKDLSVISQSADGHISGLLSKQSAVSETGVPSVQVGDWLNFRLMLDGSLVTDEKVNENNIRELLHHGAQPGRPGYTLQEIGMLARSSVSQQRTLAWSMLGNIIHKARTQQYNTINSNVMVFLIVRLPLIPLLRAAIDDTAKSVHAAAIYALLLLIEPYPGYCSNSNTNLLYNSTVQSVVVTKEPKITTDIDNHIYTQPRSGVAVVHQDSTRIFQDEEILDSIYKARGTTSKNSTKNSKTEEALGIDQLATFDIIATLLPMSILPRLRYLIDMQCEFLRNTTNLTTELLPKVKACKTLLVQLLQVLLCITMHSTSSTTLIHFTPFLHGCLESSLPTSLYDLEVITKDVSKLPILALLAQLNVQIVVIVCKIQERITTVDSAYGVQWTSRATLLSKLTTYILTCPTTAMYHTSPSRNILTYTHTRAATACIQVFSVLLKYNVQTVYISNIMHVHLLPYISLFPQYTSITNESTELVCVYKHVYNSYLGLHAAVTRLYEVMIGTATLDLLYTIEHHTNTPTTTLTQLGMATEQVLSNITSNMNNDTNNPIVPNTLTYYTSILQYLASYYSAILLHPQLGSPAMHPIVQPERKLDDNMIVEMTRQYLQISKLVSLLLDTSVSNVISLNLHCITQGRPSNTQLVKFINPTTKYLCPALPYVEIVSCPTQLVSQDSSKNNADMERITQCYNEDLTLSIYRLVSINMEVYSLLQHYTHGLDIQLHTKNSDNHNVKKVLVDAFPMHKDNRLTLTNQYTLPFTSHYFITLTNNILHRMLLKDDMIQHTLFVKLVVTTVFTNFLTLHNSIPTLGMSSTQVVVSNTGALYIGLELSAATQECILSTYTALLQVIPVLLYQGDLGYAIECLQLLGNDHLHSILASLIQKKTCPSNTSVALMKETLQHFTKSVPALQQWCHFQVDTIDSSIGKLQEMMDIVYNTETPQSVFMSPTDDYNLISTNNMVYIPIYVDIYTNGDVIKTIQHQYTHTGTLTKLSDQLLPMTRTMLHRCTSMVFIQSLGSTYTSINLYSSLCKMLLEEQIPIHSSTTVQVYPSAYTCGITLKHGSTSFICSPLAGVYNHQGYFIAPVKIISDIYNQNQDHMEKLILQVATAGNKKQEYLTIEIDRLQSILLNANNNTVTTQQKEGQLAKLRELVQEQSTVESEVTTEINTITKSKIQQQKEQTTKLQHLQQASTIFLYSVLSKQENTKNTPIDTLLSHNTNVKMCTTTTTSLYTTKVCSSVYTALEYIFLMGYDVYTTVSPYINSLIAILHNPSTTFPLTEDIYTTGLHTAHLELADINVMNQWNGIVGPSSSTSIQALLSVPHLHNLHYKLYTSVVDLYLEDSSCDVGYTNYLLPYLSKNIPRDYPLYLWNKVFVENLRSFQEQPITMSVNTTTGTAVHPYHMYYSQYIKNVESNTDYNIDLSSYAPALFSAGEGRVLDTWKNLVDDVTLDHVAPGSTVVNVQNVILYLLCRNFIITNKLDVTSVDTTPQAMLDILLSCEEINKQSIPAELMLQSIDQSIPLEMKYQQVIHNILDTLHASAHNSTVQVLINVLENVQYK